MRWVTKEDNISTLIEHGKKMLSSDKYLFVTTIDMIEHLEMNLETFCEKIDQKTIISGYKEKTLKLLQDTEGVFPVGVSRFELVILGIKKELIEKVELEKFVNVDEELLPIIQVINSLEGSEILPQGNKEELCWFIDKIHGKKIEYTDHYVTSFTESPLANAEANNSLEELSWGRVRWEPKIERFRPSAMVYETVSWHLVEGGQFDIAENFHKLAIGLDPEYYFAMEQLAQLYLTSKQPAKALPLIEKAIEINPKFSYLKLVLGYYYIATRKFDHALIEFEKIDLELPFPDMEKVSIILMKSKAKLLMGDLDAALSYCIEASTLCSPDKPINDTENSLYFAWSEILKRKGDYQGAIEVIKLLLKKEPDNIPSWNNIGFLYSNYGDSDKAIEALEHAHKIDDKEPNVLMNLGVEYLRKDEPQKALQCYVKAETSLEEGYDKYTATVDGRKVTNTLLAIAKNAILVLTEGNQEKIKSFIDTFKLRQEKQQQKKFDEELDAPHLPLKKRRKSTIRCKRAIQNYIRMKYHDNPNKFKKDFPSNYDDAARLFEQDQKGLIPGQKDADFFNFIDTGVFPFIIKEKKKEWNLELDTGDMLSMLYFQTQYRRKTAHESGEEDGELDETSANARYWNEQMLIRFFEAKINE